MDEQRAEFEAWMRDTHGPGVNLVRSDDGYISTVPHRVVRMTYASVQMLWEAWQAATQRQQERIAEIEADIAHKDAYAEQLGRLLFKAGAERQELEAQVQALSLDAGRWKTFISLPYAIRAEWACNLSLVPVLTQWIDQAAINAAVESRKEQS